ncbi:MAG: Wzz/FepE/Etk N-terminal domain-containing protein [Bacteroidales bacterium]
MTDKKERGYNFNSVDLLIYIWKKRFILITVGVIAGVTAIIVSLLITPMYKSSVIMFPASSANISKELLVQNYAGRQNVHGFGEEEQAEQLLQVLHSQPIRSRVVDKYNLMEHYEIDSDSKYPMTELYDQYKSNINFRLTEFMSVEISVMDKDPELSAAIANDIADLVDTVYNDMKKERAREALRLVEREFRGAERNLEQLQDSLNQLSHNLSRRVSLEDENDPTNNLIRAVTENGALYISMLNLVRNESQIVAGLSLRYKEARLEAEQDLPYKFVVERAFPPEKKAYPNKSLIVIVSTFGALLFALIVLIVIDSIRERVAMKQEE